MHGSAAVTEFMDFTWSYTTDCLQNAKSFNFRGLCGHAVHNDLVRSIDGGKVSLLVLLDLSAAFDTVDHHILLSVLASRFSIASTTLSWFKSYLADRTQLFTYIRRRDRHLLRSRLQRHTRLRSGPMLLYIIHRGPRWFAGKTCCIQSHLYADDIQLI